MDKGINTLKDLLIDCLIEDLSDPDKRSPGLYQVVARVVADNKSDTIPAVRAETLEGLSPFKLKKQAQSAQTAQAGTSLYWPHPL